jgi:D-3-phosphoglycerate dehydrogenase / 2-oxoglutarate reductase
VQVAAHRVVLTDQVFPDVELERELLAEVDAELIVPQGGRDEVLREAETADALLNTYLPIGRDDIARLANTRIIARYGIGVDNIDLAAAKERGIVVTNVPDYCVEEVAVHTLLLILASVRRLPQSLAAATRPQWTLDGLRPIPRMSELTIGIVGLGRIGRRVVELLRPIGARLIGYDPYAGASIDGIEVVPSLEALLGQSDVVSLHVPMSDATRGLISREQLGQMRRSAILVNTSRGGLVRTADLADALRDGTIAGAAVDVLEKEAADAGAIVGLPGALVTPHVAYYSEASLRESQRKAATQIVRVLTGQSPEYAVN